MEEDEIMVILCKRTSEILMCFIVLQYLHCSSIVFSPNETHSSLTLVLALSCWMQMPKPDKNPQCRNKESSVESPAEKNFWLAVIVFVEEGKKINS